MDLQIIANCKHPIGMQIIHVCHMFCFCHRKAWETFIVSPSDDLYYYWLFFIAAAVLYNWVLLVARYDFSPVRFIYIFIITLIVKGVVHLKICPS